MIKKVATDYAESVWNEKDLSAIDKLIDPNCVIHSVLGNFCGPAAMHKIVKSWLIGFPDMSVTNLEVITEKDRVVIQWQAQGTHRGEFKGIQPSGKSVSYRGVSVYRIDQGKVVEYWTYIDMHHLLEQIRGNV